MADLIKASQGGINIVLVFLPKLLQSILTYLEEEGLVDKASLNSDHCLRPWRQLFVFLQVLVREYCWQMIPVDTDVFSLELPLFFSQVKKLSYLLGVKDIIDIISPIVVHHRRIHVAAECGIKGTV